EHATAARACTGGGDGTPMHLHEHVDQCEPKPQPSTGAPLVRGHLREHPEDVLNRIRRNADSVVSYCNRGVLLFAIQGDTDRPARVGVFSAIGEQIRDDLYHSIRIDLRDQIRRANIDTQLMSTSLDEAASTLHRTVEYVG